MRNSITDSLVQAGPWRIFKNSLDRLWSTQDLLHIILDQQLKLKIIHFKATGLGYIKVIIE